MLPCLLAETLVIIQLLIAVDVSRGLVLEITYGIEEEEPPRTFVGNIGDDIVKLVSITPEEKRELRYSFLKEGNANSVYFKINNATGEIRTTRVLDREQLCNYQSFCILPVEVGAQSATGIYFRVIRVKIHVFDINDNAPIFPEMHMNINISESVMVDSHFPIDAATDKDTGDTNSVQSYHILPEDSPFGLYLSKNPDGRYGVSLQLESKLDRERSDHLTVYVIAKDNGRPVKSGTLTINVNVLDFNDNSPVFTSPSYDVNINESTQVNSVIFRVHASDKDLGDNGMINYRFSQHQAEAILQSFSIHPDTGDISVIKSLKYNPGERYQIVVEAADKGHPSLSVQAIVNVRVIDNMNDRPKTTITMFTGGKVNEKAQPEQVIAHLRVVDNDSGRNGYVTCSLNDTTFELKPHRENDYRVVLVGELDRETKDEYIVQVLCKDSGNPPLHNIQNFRVTILDDNDNPPEFTLDIYKARLMENLEPGTPFFGVRAFDADIGDNGNFEFSMEQNMKQYFDINPHNGNITAKVKFDRESRSLYQFRVYASDFGQPHKTGTSLVEVTIGDANDNIPNFGQPQYVTSISENRPPTNVQTIDVSDKDDKENSDFLIDILEKDVPFQVVNDKGKRILRSSRAFDREKKAQYNFTLTAVDKVNGSHFSTAKFTVNIDDENDNSPQIKYPKGHNNITIGPETQPGRTLITFYAEDRDIGRNGEVSYHIENPVARSLFQIDQKTGNLSLLRHVRSGDRTEYNVTVTVTDGGSPLMLNYSTIKIEVSFTNLSGGIVMQTSESKNNIFEKYIFVIIAMIVVALALVAAIIVTILFFRRRGRTRGACSGESRGKAGDSEDSKFVDTDTLVSNSVKKSQKVPSDRSWHEDGHGGFIQKSEDYANSTNGSGPLSTFRVSNVRFADTVDGGSNTTQRKSKFPNGLTVHDSSGEEAHSEATSTDSGKGGSIEEISGEVIYNTNADGVPQKLYVREGMWVSPRTKSKTLGKFSTFLSEESKRVKEMYSCGDNKLPKSSSMTGPNYKDIHDGLKPLHKDSGYYSPENYVNHDVIGDHSRPQSPRYQKNNPSVNYVNQPKEMLDNRYDSVDYALDSVRNSGGHPPERRILDSMI